MATETLQATSLTAGAVSGSANALGAVNGTWTTDTGATSWTARFAMADVVGTQANGTHTVTIRVRKIAGQSGTPSVTSIALYEGSTLIATITGGSTNVTSTSGQDIAPTFDSSILAGRNLDNIEVEIVTLAAGGNPSTRTPVQLDAITWTGDFTTPVNNGSTAGAFSWAGSSTGARTSLGSTTGAFSWAGSATGDNGEAVALPVLIDVAGTHVEEESHSYCPVYVDTNGNLYTITESLLAANNQPRAMKSTDRGDTWVEMDAANRPGTDTGSIGDLESGWITQEPGYLSFSWQRSYPVWVRFRTSDHPTDPDTWMMNTRNQVGSGSGLPQYMSHTKPTDQSYHWTFYGNGTGADYVSVDSLTGVDGTPATLDATATGPAAVLNETDQSSYVVYKKSGQLHYKRLTSGGTLDGASTRVDTNGVHAVDLPHAKPVFYTNGGDDIVTCVFLNGSGHVKAVDITNGTPGAEETITTTACLTDPGDTGNAGAVLTADVDGDTMHVFWSNASNGDLMHSSRPFGGSWTTPEVVRDTFTTGVYWLYAKVVEFPDSERVVTLRYSDGFDSVGEINDLYYDEFALAVQGFGSTSGVFTWAGSATGVRRNVSDWSAVVSETTLSGTPTGSASGVHTWAGSATGARPSEGSTVGAFSWIGSATGARPSEGAASGAFSWAGSSTGARASAGSTAGAFSWVGDADGVAPLLVQDGSASGSFTWAGSASGARISLGSASGVHTWAGDADGVAPLLAQDGSASGVVTWTGSATGARISLGSATGASSWVGSATGARVSLGSSVGVVTWAGSTTGARDSSGSASGAVTWAGDADGAAALQGSASGVHTWTGDADGSAPLIGVNNGSASGTHTWTGAATGARTSEGSTAGAFSWAGSASGSRPASGSTAGAVVWGGGATGSTVKQGSASGVHTWAGDADGVTPLLSQDGAASGTHTWQGSATGQRDSLGSTTGSVSWLGAGAGGRTSLGSVVGVLSWAGDAAGSHVSSGSATGATSWVGSAVGSETLPYVPARYPQTTVAARRADSDLASTSRGVTLTGRRAGATIEPEEVEP